MLSKRAAYFALCLFLSFCCMTSPSYSAETRVWTQQLNQDFFGILSDLGGEARRLIDEPSRATGLDAHWVVGSLAILGGSYLVDSTVSRELQSHGGTLSDLSDVASVVGSPYLHLGSAGGLYLVGSLTNSRSMQVTGIQLGEALVLADTATLILKQASGRVRPRASGQKDDWNPFSFEHDVDSFPSMHTASSFAMASVLSQSTDQVAVTVTTYTLAGLVGAARINQGAHWLSDVVAGAIIGDIAGRMVIRYHGDRATGRFMVLPTRLNNGAGVAMVVRF